MPEPSYVYLGSDAPDLDLSDVDAKLRASEEQRQEAVESSRNVQKALRRAQIDLERNKGNAAESIRAIRTSVAEAIEAMTKDEQDNASRDRIPRNGNLGYRVEDLCRFMAFHHFLETGTMLPPSACTFSETAGATDEEYLAGGCMGVAHDLSRYAMGRATVRDVPSVQNARDLVHEILEYLLRFDLRNGQLRRKYDGTKYALKAVETLLYELSVTGASLQSTDGGEPDAKKARLEKAEPSPIQEELEALRLRMEHRDNLRETLIKQSRDGQKAAKQSIYALHRGDYAKAAKLLQACEDCILQKLMPIVKEEPSLSMGCYGGVLEEYAEAKLFFTWLKGNDETTTTTAALGATKMAPKRTLMLFKEFTVVPLDPGAYLGGLCDLTGEIGRFAVQRGTVRDYEGVHQCLEANAAVLEAIQGLDRLPQKISKKMQALRQSVSKIERMIYEMSLSKAAGMKKSSEVSENSGSTADMNDE